MTGTVDVPALHEFVEEAERKKQEVILFLLTSNNLQRINKLNKKKAPKAKEKIEILEKQRKGTGFKYRIRWPERNNVEEWVNASKLGHWKDEVNSFDALSSTVSSSSSVATTPTFE